MRSRSEVSRRKATWVAFGLVALAASTYGQEAPAAQNGLLEVQELPDTTTYLQPTTTNIAFSENEEFDGEANVCELALPKANLLIHLKTPPSKQEQERAEASRAYRQAMSTLQTLTAYAPAHTYDPAAASAGLNTKSIFSSFLPNPQGQGPVGSAWRIALKLHQSFTRLTSGLRPDYPLRRREEEMRTKAIKVIDLLHHSVELGNPDALYTLAKVALFPPTSHFRLNATLAFLAFKEHAELTGNPSSQAFLAFYYATGYQDVVPVDQARAQLYYTFAANGGDKGAQMALGYRYWSGIGTSENCQRAVMWYELASEQAMDKFISGPPGGRTLPPTATRLSDLVGGVYGPGASVASTGLNTQRAAIKAGVARAAGETWEDVLEYYLFNADRGETDFAYRLGKIFYQGSIYAAPGGIASGSEGVGAVPRNYGRAMHYFLQIARQVWPRDPVDPSRSQQVPTKEETGPVGYAAASAGYIGRMYLRGEGIKADPATAKMWFERGAEHGDRECHNGLGIIYRDGLVPGVKADVKIAVHHFKHAATQELAEAQVNLAKYYYFQGDLAMATTYFEAAVRHGSPFEAYYYLGEIYSEQTANPSLPANIVSGACAMAVSFHKHVAERGRWDEDLLREADIAWNMGTDQGKEIAMLKWWIAAERGHEIAQNNLAFLLDQDKSILRLTRFSPINPSNDTARLSLTQWTRAAAQRNIDALVKVGDYYYHGLGVSPDEPETARYEKAAKYYQSAADTQVSALAMWNLGWMYENGIGVPQDFHLAKRHYDLALETNSEAYVPVLLSLAKLYVRSAWHTLMGGEGGLSLWAYDEEPELEMEMADPRDQDTKQVEGIKDPVINDDRYDDDDGQWYFGKARDEYTRKRQDGQGSSEHDDDPVQWARNRRNAEHDRDSDFGPEDYFEGALRGGHRGEEDVDEFQETMLLVLICALISVLLYVRTRIVDRMRRDNQREAQQGQQQQQQQQERGNGLFPPPGDPARDDWAIMR
ncbi:hypothetical protein AX16_003996 [Volvariella volvacea WC 439]|nr:hypothetical protein AX16_003996 [Volvariella volvacea WC 439]